MRLRMRRNVDLPQPDGPIERRDVSARMSSDTFEHLVVAEPRADVSADRGAGRRAASGDAGGVGRGEIDR